MVCVILSGILFGWVGGASSGLRGGLPVVGGLGVFVGLVWVWGCGFVVAFACDLRLGLVGVV